MHAQSCLTLYDPMDCSLAGSAIHGIFQARILEWVAVPAPGDPSDRGIKGASLVSLALAGGFFTIWEKKVSHLFLDKNVHHSRILYDPPPRILEIKAKLTNGT